MKRKTSDNYDNTVDGKELKKIKRLVFQINEDNEEENEDIPSKDIVRTTINKSIKSDSESDISDEEEVEFEKDDCEAINEEDKTALDKFLKPGVVEDVINEMKEAKKEVSELMGYDEIEELDFENDEGLIEHLKSLKDLMTRYKKGRLFPKVIKVLPQFSNWNYFLEQLDFHSWSSSAVKVFSDQIRAKGGATVETYFMDFLLPFVREHIAQHKRLDNTLYETLQSAIFRRREFIVYFLLPWCRDNITGREAEILSSIIKSSTIKLDVAAPALTILMNEMEYSRDRLIVIRAFIDKKYNLPYETINFLADYFHRAVGIEGQMPLIWFQTLNLFLSLYYRSLNEEGVRKLEQLCRVHRHDKVTPSVLAFLRMKSSAQPMDM